MVLYRSSELFNVHQKSKNLVQHLILENELHPTHTVMYITHILSLIIIETGAIWSMVKVNYKAEEKVHKKNHDPDRQKNTGEE